MELLLLEDIPGVGKQNDIIVVKDGFALNNLLPKKRALVATPTVRKRYAEQIRRRAEEKALEQEIARSAAGVLQDKQLTFAKKATENGKLYGAISEADIAEGISLQLQVEVPEANVLISEPLKTVGVHTVQIKLGEQEVDLKVEVKREEEK